MAPGPCTYTQGDLEFTFGATRAVVLKWDDTAAYRNALHHQVEGSRAVDFVGLRGRDLYLVEVKDYRGSERTPTTRRTLRDGGTGLVDTVAVKVRDTVAGIVGAARLGRATEAAALARSLVDAGAPLWVILWLEHAATLPNVKPSVQALRDKARGGVETDRLQAALRWLGAHTLICARADQARVPGIAVRSTPGAKRRAPPSR